ncbi:GNAT family N-acetyltransferase [Blastococcus xanthinilyticus]|uniref:GNAT family N-acetyltransferase n=1 Tax=Blastococcus xanthinilyticus TaxID=1564164 RepID=UPI001AA1301C|nr:GNAT family N-acetyltransferase [Blastococcus xanthinilyticus]
MTDAAEQHRYEARVDGELAAIAEYIRTPELVVFTHTEVLAGHQGRGISSGLVGQALDDVRRQGLKVLPLCPFVARYMERHAQAYGDLEYRSRTTLTDVTA